MFLNKIYFVVITENCRRMTGGVVAGFVGNRWGRPSLSVGTREPMLLGNVCDLFTKLLTPFLLTTMSFCPDATIQNIYVLDAIILNLNNSLQPLLLT